MAEEQKYSLTEILKELEHNETRLMALRESFYDFKPEIQILLMTKGLSPTDKFSHFKDKTLFSKLCSDFSNMFGPDSMVNNPENYDGTSYVNVRHYLKILFEVDII